MYQCEVDRVDKHEWHAIVQAFSDASMYQTWSFAAARWGASSLSHLALKRNGEVVAAAQLVIVRVPLLGAGIAHLKFGPMWRSRNHAGDTEIYAQILRALRQEYVERRGLLLRIKPWEVEEDRAILQPVREAEGFSLQRKLPHYITYVVDLSASRAELFERLRPNWRRHLKQAQRQDLKIRLVEGPEAVRIFIDLYREMRARKRFQDTSEATLLELFYTDLPEALRPRIIVTSFNGENVAADVVSAMGDVGFCLFGVTTPSGRALRASYLSQWWSLDWFKRQGCRWCDLVGGYADPGLRQFKMGLAGGDRARLEYMGDFDACSSISSQLTVRLGSSLRLAQQNARGYLGDLRDKYWSTTNNANTG